MKAIQLSTDNCKHNQLIYTISTHSSIYPLPVVTCGILSTIEIASIRELTHKDYKTFISQSL